MPEKTVGQKSAIKILKKNKYNQNPIARLSAKKIMEEDMKSFFKKLTLESCKESASKYNSRNEWRKSENTTYDYASINGWLEECCSHMKTLRLNHTLESCKESASKYNSRNEWRELDFNIYRYAMKNGWLDECCSHMKKQ